MPNGTVSMPKGVGVGGRIQIYAACREAGFPPSMVFPFVVKTPRSDFLRVRENVREGRKTIGGIAESTTEVTALEYTPTVQAAVAQLRHHLNLTRDDIIAGMMDAVYSAANSQELVAAWREIGKLIGAYAPSRVQIEHTNTNNNLLQRISLLSDVELARLIKQPEQLSIGRE